MHEITTSIEKKIPSRATSITEKVKAVFSSFINSIKSTLNPKPENRFNTLSISEEQLDNLKKNSTTRILKSGTEYGKPNFYRHDFFVNKGQSGVNEAAAAQNDQQVYGLLSILNNKDNNSIKSSNFFKENIEAKEYIRGQEPILHTPKITVNGLNGIEKIAGPNDLAKLLNNLKNNGFSDEKIIFITQTFCKNVIRYEDSKMLLQKDLDPKDLNAVTLNYDTKSDNIKIIIDVKNARLLPNYIKTPSMEIYDNTIKKNVIYKEKVESKTVDAKIELDIPKEGDITRQIKLS